MAWLGWAVAAVLALLLIFRRRPPAPAPPEAPRPSAVDPSPDLEALPSSGLAVSSAGASGFSSPPSLEEREIQAIRGTLSYLRRTVVPPLARLRGRVSDDLEAERVLLQALDALEDLVFHADPPPAETPAPANLAEVVQQAVREYTIETRVPVRVHPPARPLQLPLRQEALKDAVFLLLANAGRFSGGRPVDVYLEAGEGPFDGGVRIRVVDAGPGFSEEAQLRALEPFWSTDPQGLGLGLPQARARISEMKGRLSLRNHPAGGGEVVVEVPPDPSAEGTGAGGPEEPAA